MNLNMAILAHELNLGGTVADSPLEFPLTFTLPFEVDLPLQPDAAYVVHISDVPLIPPEPRKRPAHLIVVGSGAKEAALEVDGYLYLEDCNSVGEMLARIAQVFKKYAKWEDELNRALIDEAPLARYGAVSRDITQNPFFLTDEGFRMFFHERERLKAENEMLYERYVTEGGFTGISPGGEVSYPPLDIIHDLVNNPSMKTAFSAKEPTRYIDEAYDYETLTYRIETSGGVYALCMDGVTQPLADFDAAICVLLGAYLQRALEKMARSQSSTVEEVAQVLENLLAHILVDEKRIERAISRLGWAINDEYLCCVLEATSAHKSEKLFASLLPQLASAVPTECFATFEGRGVLVVNLKRCALGADEAVIRLGAALEQAPVRAAVSRTYRDFKDLHYYHRQCLAALALTQADAGAGAGNEDCTRVVEYEHVALNDALNRLRRDDPTWAQLPCGLRALIDYDAQKSSNLVGLLRAYLDCHLNITETCRATFMARNTCLYRISRIAELTGADFHDSNTRLEYALALRLLAAQDVPAQTQR